MAQLILPGGAGKLTVPKHLRPLKRETLVYFFKAKSKSIRPSYPPGYPDGEMDIPPTAEARTRDGWQRVEVVGAKEIEKVSRKFEHQKRDYFQRGDILFHTRQMAEMGRIQDKLKAKMISASCSSYERAFIRKYLATLDAEIEKHRQRKFEMYLAIEAKEAPLGK